MSTLSVNGTRLYKNSGDASLNVSASVDFMCDGKLNREGIFALYTIANGEREYTIEHGDVKITLTRGDKNWSYAHNDESKEVAFCQTRRDTEKPLSESNRDFRVDLFEAVGDVVNTAFPELKVSTRAPGKVKKLTAERDTYRELYIAALKEAGLSEEKIAQKIAALSENNPFSRGKVSEDRAKELKTE